MGGGFACPECGREISPGGLTPGREVLCPGCSTLVEVPYLPRAAGWKRRRGGRGRGRSAWLDSKLLRAAVGLAAVAVVGLAASRFVGGRVRSDRERVLAELVASADEAQADGKLDAAYYQIEAALAQARTMDLDGSARLAALRLRRDRASACEADARLATIDALDPDLAVGESLTLAERARGDRALAPRLDAIAAKLEASRLRQARADLDAARRALDAADGPAAFAAARRLHDRAGKLGEADSRRLRDDAEGVIEAAVGRFGIALPPASGRFAAGSGAAYDAALDRHLAEILGARGYLVQPRRSAWRSTWDDHAPFLLTIRIVEEQGEYYLQSKNKITQIEGFLDLAHRGRPVWQGRLVSRTRVPLLDLPAYLAGHLATSGRHDAQVERRFHADALAQFVDQAVRNLRGLPPREKADRLP